MLGGGQNEPEEEMAFVLKNLQEKPNFAITHIHIGRHMPTV